MSSARTHSVAIGVSMLLGVAVLPGVAAPAWAATDCGAYFAAHAGGSGSAADPYRVDSAEALDTVRHCADKAFLQTTDIDLSAYSPWTPILGSERTGWFGVGTFVGTYDGGGHTITGLTVRDGIPDPDVADVDYGVGLFAGVEQGGVSHLTVAGATIAYDHVDRDVLGVGILAGSAGNGARLTDVTVSGSVSVRAGVAGLVGGLTGGFGETSVDTASTMDRATSSADVSVWSPATDPRATAVLAVGGLVGGVGYLRFLDPVARTQVRAAASGPTITRSRATGSVSSDADGADTLATGGFAGFLGAEVQIGFFATERAPEYPPASVSQSSATGSVKGRFLVGGFVGYVGYFGSMADCLSRGAATGARSVAGLTGGIESGGTVRDCYATGRVTGTTDTGGLVAPFTVEPTGRDVDAGIAPVLLATSPGTTLRETPVAVTSSYWDVETSGIAASACVDAALCGTGSTTALMKTRSTYSGWAFGPFGDAAAAWGMCSPPFNDYPFLWTFQASDPCPAVPGAPQDPSATAGDARATVSWAKPASDGGSTIIAYTVTGTALLTSRAGADAPTCTTTGALSCIVTGLANGTRYTFAVTATNAVGTGPASVATTAVIPTTSQRPLKPLNLPSRLRNSGWTRIVSVPVPTNAGQNARVRVTCRPVLRSMVPAGDVVTCRVARRDGAVRVWLSGRRAAVVRVVVRARAVPGYTGYRTVRVYRTKAVR